MEGWKRTYWTVWTANLITAIGMMSFLPFFPSHLEALGLTDRNELALWAGVLYGAAPLSAAVMSPIWGSIGDRYGRRLMVLRSMGAISLFVGAMAFADTPLQLLFLRIGQGVFSGFVAPSTTLVSVIAPADQQGRITGSLQTALAAGAIVGPALGGIALGAGVGLRHVFLGVSAAALLAGVLVLLFAREDAAQRTAPESGARRVFVGTLRDLRDVLANRGLRGALLIVFVIQLGLGSTNPLLELFVRDLDVQGPLTTASTSALFSAMAAVNLPAMPLWGRYGDRVGHRKAMVQCSLASAAAFLLHAWAPSYALLFCARILLGMAIAGVAPCAYGLAAGEISVARRGSAFGVLFSARTLAVAISAMAGGWLSRFIGIRGLFVVGGVLVLAAVVVLTRSRSGASSPAR